MCVFCLILKAEMLSPLYCHFKKNSFLCRFFFHCYFCLVWFSSFFLEGGGLLFGVFSCFFVCWSKCKCEKLSFLLVYQSRLGKFKCKTKERTNAQKAHFPRDTTVNSLSKYFLKVYIVTCRPDE